MNPTESPELRGNQKQAKKKGKHPPVREQYKERSLTFVLAKMSGKRPRNNFDTGKKSPDISYRMETVQLGQGFLDK